MTKKIPRGDENLICRWHKQPMSEVCHKCDAWTHLAGSHPNTGESIDDWKCADSWIPILLLEIAKRTHGVSAEIGSLRAEETKAHEEAKAREATMAARPTIGYPVIGAFSPHMVPPRLIDARTRTEGE